MSDTLRKVREAVKLVELETLIEQHAQFSRHITLNNKRTERIEERVSTNDALRRIIFKR